MSTASGDHRMSGRRAKQSRLRKAALDVWFAVQRMRYRGPKPTGKVADYYPIREDDDDDPLAGSPVPRRPSPSSGSANIAIDESDEPLIE
jgi:hypothetical protein